MKLCKHCVARFCISLAGICLIVAVLVLVIGKRENDAQEIGIEVDEGSQQVSPELDEDA